MEVGREVCLRKKKNDKKEKGLKKRVRKGDQKKKKDKMVGTFPLSEILNGKHTATFWKRRYLFIQNIAICLSKTKRKNGGNFPTQQNFEREKVKNFG